MTVGIPPYTPYIIEWPEELVAIGHAVARRDRDALRTLIARFPPPALTESMGIVGSDDPAQCHVSLLECRLRLPCLYYLLCTELPHGRRTWGLYLPVRHDLDALEDADLARLGVGTKRLFDPDPSVDPEAAGEIDKRSVLRQLVPLGLPFRYSERLQRRRRWPLIDDPTDESRARTWLEPPNDGTRIWYLDDESWGVPLNPFNDLLGQLLKRLSQHRAWCMELLDLALAMGATMDMATLKRLRRADPVWYGHLRTRLPPGAVLAPRDLDKAEQRALWASALTLDLIRDGRLAQARPGEDGWLHAVLTLGLEVAEQVRCMTWLVREGGHDVNHRGQSLRTPLRFAVYKRVPELVECLLELGADPNLEDQRGDTLLHRIAWLGYAELVGPLLRHGADPHARNHRGRTPKQMAEAFRHAEIAAMLPDDYSHSQNLPYARPGTGE